MSIVKSNLVKPLLAKIFSAVLSSLFLSANLQAASQPAGGQSQPIWLQLLPLVFIFLIFYFLIIRPQQKKLKKHRMMVDSLDKGDDVIISSGIYGKITKVNEDGVSVLVEIADKTVIRATKESITVVLNKPTSPKVAEKDENAKKSSKK